MATPRRHPDLDVTDFHGILTVAPEMRALFQKIERAGRSDASVLVRGESGTGKELVARALHDCSRRKSKPFRAVNCATFTSDLLASELFGHTRGSFTGAVRDKPGLLQLADGGTVFLDEIAEMAPDIQARLLRVLQEQRFFPLGSSTPVEVNVRLVSATHEALRERVADGQFREDLMYRVRVVVLYLPRLAERTGDVEALAWHFIETFNAIGLRRVDGIHPQAWDAMQAYGWPGNIRELRNNIEQAFALGEGPTLMLEDLAPELQESHQGASSAPGGVLGSTVAVPHVDGATTWKDVERQRILEALTQTGGRRQEAAELLDMSRSTLWRKLKEHGIT